MSHLTYPSREIRRSTWARGTSPNYEFELQQWKRWAISDLLTEFSRGVLFDEPLTLHFEDRLVKDGSEVQIVLVFEGELADAVARRL